MIYKLHKYHLHFHVSALILFVIMFSIAQFVKTYASYFIEPEQKQRSCIYNADFFKPIVVKTGGYLLEASVPGKFIIESTTKVLCTKENPA